MGIPDLAAIAMALVASAGLWYQIWRDRKTDTARRQMLDNTVMAISLSIGVVGAALFNAGFGGWGLTLMSLQASVLLVRAARRPLLSGAEVVMVVLTSCTLTFLFAAYFIGRLSDQLGLLIDAVRKLSS